jgi:hypothetical protein
MHMCDTRQHYVLSQASLFGVYGGKSGSGTEFSPSTSVFPQCLHFCGKPTLHMRINHLPLTVYSFSN